MTNRAKAIEIFKLLEDNHINLYHDITKEDFLKELDKFLDIADNLDDIHFDAGMSRLFSLFKDAHTQYEVKGDYVDANIKFIENKFYYYDQQKQICDEIVKINGVDFETIYNKIKPLIQYDDGCDGWLHHSMLDFLRSVKYMQMIDCAGDDLQKITYTLGDGSIIESKLTDINKSEHYYSFEKISDDIIRVKYSKCRNNPDYPFAQFVEDSVKTLDRIPGACLLDIRDNGGGSDGVIRPLVSDWGWLAVNKIKTYVLMNEGVFSGGVFALMDAKRCLNATFVGTESGQGANHYGNMKWGKVGDKEFCWSTRYFNGTTVDTKQSVESFHLVKPVFDYTGPIKPDIYLSEKPEDVRLGIDGQLRDSLDIIKKELDLENILTAV